MLQSIKIMLGNKPSGILHHSRACRMTAQTHQHKMLQQNCTTLQLRCRYPVKLLVSPDRGTLPALRLPAWVDTPQIFVAATVVSIIIMSSRNAWNMPTQPPKTLSTKNTNYTAGIIQKAREKHFHSPSTLHNMTVPPNITTQIDDSTLPQHESLPIQSLNRKWVAFAENPVVHPNTTPRLITQVLARLLTDEALHNHPMPISINNKLPTIKLNFILFSFKWSNANRFQ